LEEHQLSHQVVFLVELQLNQILNQPVHYLEEHQLNHQEVFLVELQQISYQEARHFSVEHHLFQFKIKVYRFLVEMLKSRLIRNLLAHFLVEYNHHQLIKSQVVHYLVKINHKLQSLQLALSLELNLSVQVIHSLEEHQPKTVLKRKYSVVMQNLQRHYLLQHLQEDLCLATLDHHYSVHRKLLINLVDHFLGKLTTCLPSLKDQSPTKNQNTVTDKKRKKTITT
jgi:hypothetical protein